MCEVLYTETEGGEWKLAILDEWSEENLMKLCEAQALPCIEPYHKVRLTGGYKAAAVMFHNGLIWDAILSGYCRATNKYPNRGLAKCYPFRFDHDKLWNNCV